MNEHSHFMRKHAPFIRGGLCGFAAACLLIFICNLEDKPVPVSQLRATLSKRGSQRRIIGYLKRDEHGVKIYESFHRAYSEGGPTLIDTVDDQSESRAYVSVTGVGDYAFSRSAPPVHGIFIGEFEREGIAPNFFGILNLGAVEFLPTDPLLYQGYVAK